MQQEHTKVKGQGWIDVELKMQMQTQVESGRGGRTRSTL